MERSTNFWEEDHWSSLFAHLRLVKVSGISGVKSEMDFIKFLLSNSPVLEQLTVKPASQEGEWELMKELLRFRRASIYAEVIYLDPWYSWLPLWKVQGFRKMASMAGLLIHFLIRGVPFIFLMHKTRVVKCLFPYEGSIILGLFFLLYFLNN